MTKKTIYDYAAEETARRAHGDAVAAALTEAGDAWREALPDGASITAVDDSTVFDTVELTTGEVLYRSGDASWTLQGWSNASKARRFRPIPSDLRPFDPHEHDPS